MAKISCDNCLKKKWGTVPHPCTFPFPPNHLPNPPFPPLPLHLPYLLLIPCLTHLLLLHLFPLPLLAPHSFPSHFLPFLSYSLFPISPSQSLPSSSTFPPPFPSPSSPYIFTSTFHSFFLSFPSTTSTLSFLSIFPSNLVEFYGYCAVRIYTRFYIFMYG